MKRSLKDNLDVLCILTVYNEIEFLPYKVEWCRRHGMRLYVIDNYSSDFSYEWCKDHSVPCHRVDTGGAFHLDKLQDEIVRTVDRLQPDWVCYNGADLFIFTDTPIPDICKLAEGMGCNIIGWPMIGICYTGEERGNPFRTYFWYRHARDLIEFVYKWSPGIRYYADGVKIPQKRGFSPPGVMINYGRTKTVDQRKNLLKRRQKAWKQGLDPTSGRHYLREKAKGWKWDKKELKDLRNSEFWKYVEDYQV